MTHNVSTLRVGAGAKMAAELMKSSVSSSSVFSSTILCGTQMDTVNSGRLNKWTKNIAPQYSSVLGGNPLHTVTTTLELQEDATGKDDITQLLKALRNIASGKPTGLKFQHANNINLVNQMNNVFGTVVNAEAERLRKQKEREIA
eukprot:UN23196